jgi:predicted DNA-binding transcriptional regulator YafY
MDMGLSFAALSGGALLRERHCPGALSAICHILYVRRTERLFALAEVLRARRTGITAQELAERFGVTVRTIYRDLDGLRDAAVPIVGERGRGGGIALDSSYGLPPVNFTAREAAILVTAGRWLERARLIPFIDTLRGAIDKVQGALPAPRQREVLRLADTLSWIGVPARAPSPAVRTVVEQAWLSQTPMHIHYDGAKGVTRRTVRVDAVVMERTLTLLNCHDLDIDEARQFELHKIQHAELRPAPAAA